MNAELLADALILLQSVNQHGHTVMWQDARRALLMRANEQNVMPPAGREYMDIVRIKKR